MERTVWKLREQSKGCTIKGKRSRDRAKDRQTTSPILERQLSPMGFPDAVKSAPQICVGITTVQDGLLDDPVLRSVQKKRKSC